MQVDAGRRLRWITPCKSKAQLGVDTSQPLPELRSSSTRYGVVETRCIASLLRLARSYPTQTPSGVNRQCTKNTA
ncbi:MAG: hypothetical protein LBK58_06915 [Prevotellaceae bacterium]|nr:hypothetical protein [Prevotellaceae bacterium]